MLSWSASPFTNCSSGEPRPGTGVALYEFERSKLYSVGLNRTVMTLPLSRAVEHRDRRLLELRLAHGGLTDPCRSRSMRDAALDAADHVVGQSIQLSSASRSANGASAVGRGV